ncbi:MAG: NAAT family transporter [Burkholderiales bacterium]
MLEWPEYIKILVALLVIVDPLAAIPAFIIMAGQFTDVDRIKIARVASIAVAAVLVVAALIGDSVLVFFGISISSFKVAGAILIFLMAISMLQVKQVRDKQTAEEEAEAQDKDSIAVVPLAIPLLAGPGAISTTIIYATESADWKHRLVIVACCLIVGMACWLGLRAAMPVSKLLGKTGINIAVRLMGLILTAVAVEIFVSGLLVLLPGLKGH